jgi:hypothetical protein
MTDMIVAQIKKVPKPPMMKMWNYGNLIGANMNIVYPENPPGVQINTFPIHQFIEKDPGNETYEESNPSGYASLTGNRII